MLVSNKNTQAGAPGLAMDNVIEFPQSADSATEAGYPRATVDTGAPTSLVHIWNRAGSQHGLDGVSAEVLDTLRRLKDADRPGALCVLRLNEYRLLEETFGRCVGQQLLELVGNRLRAGLRGHDLLEQVAEDEFVLILDGQSDSEQLANIAQRLLTDCSGVYTLEGLRMHVNASLGIARFPVDAGEPGPVDALCAHRPARKRPVQPFSLPFFLAKTARTAADPGVDGRRTRGGAGARAF